MLAQVKGMALMLDLLDEVVEMFDLKNIILQSS